MVHHLAAHDFFGYVARFVVGMTRSYPARDLFRDHALLHATR